MHSTDDLSMADYRALAEIRYQIRHFLHFSEQAAREVGLHALGALLADDTDTAKVSPGGTNGPQKHVEE